MQLRKPHQHRGLGRFVFRVVSTASLLAVLVAVAAALFGALCGLVFWARYGEAGVLAVLISRCALAGAAAGALVGGLGRLLDGTPAQASAWFPRPLTSPSSRNGSCPPAATPPWRGSPRQHRPFFDWGSRRLAD
jgi:hypothetical protein